MISLPHPIAVIDVETTGLFPTRNDRIIEIAIVTIERDLSIDLEKSYVSLVNPERDIGSSRIHGIVSSQVLNAPSFKAISPVIIEKLSGSMAIGGHNVSFDIRFLASELSRIGYSFPDFPTICTMQWAGGGKLSHCCKSRGIQFEGAAHTALADAMATAELLLSLLSKSPGAIEELTPLQPIIWPQICMPAKEAYTRLDAEKHILESTSYLHRLLYLCPESKKRKSEAAQLSYISLVDSFLEDRIIDTCEANSLIEAAKELGLAGSDVQKAHESYLLGLAQASISSGCIAKAKSNDLYLVAHLLGIPKPEADTILSEAYNSHSSIIHALPIQEHSLANKTICFTGELQGTFKGEPITRKMAEVFALEAGLLVCKNVTKNVDILVVSDPHTQSGKAQKAKIYKIRIMQELVFWRSIGLEVD